MRLVTSFAARVFLNHKFKHIGHMTKLSIDSDTKTITLSADLLGEDKPIDASFRYAIEEEKGHLYFVPTDIQCSRPWLTLLAGELFAAQPPRLPIPDGLPATVLKVLKL